MNYCNNASKRYHWWQFIKGLLVLLNWVAAERYQTKRMTRMIAMLLLVLILAASNAMAEWVEIPSPRSDGLVVVYVDSEVTSMMRKPGKYQNAWSMYDYKEPQAAIEDEFYRSQKTQLKLDCVNERVGQLYSILYVGQMGLGDVVARFVYDLEDTWIPVAPGTLGAAIWKYFCA